MSSVRIAKQFTLGDLAKIALGATELTHEHLNVLQNLLIILLQKLNCQNESVRFKGYAATCIRKSFDDNSKSNKCNIQFETVKLFQEKYELLEALEQKTKQIDLKMQEHFEQIRRCHKTDVFHAKNWDYYAAADEDLCTLYMKHNKELCLMARNPIFNNVLRRNLYPQIVERIMEFESKIERMQGKLKDIISMAENAAEKHIYIELIISDIENVRATLKKRDRIFRETILECQEMLNCKLERFALPSLKKYLEQSFSVIREQLKSLKAQSKKCFNSKQLKMEDKKTCLSCGCRQEYNLSQMFLKSIAESKKCFCSNSLKKSTILEKIDRIKLSEGNLVFDYSSPVSSTRMSRYSAVNKSQLILDSSRDFTRYASLHQVNKPVANNVIMKSSLKKPQTLEPQEEKLESINVVALTRDGSLEFVGHVVHVDSSSKQHSKSKPLTQGLKSI